MSSASNRRAAGAGLPRHKTLDIERQDSVFVSLLSNILVDIILLAGLLAHGPDVEARSRSATSAFSQFLVVRLYFSRAQFLYIIAGIITLIK